MSLRHAQGSAMVEQRRTIPWMESVESSQEQRPSSCRGNKMTAAI